ncbi:hypothetical protein [Sphingomonas oligophenolica]|uniref:hypothetical protein n=1 Tax=Sphingomonas oligophenolica TaxID=301154 RepID=UPI0031D6E006
MVDLESGVARPDIDTEIASFRIAAADRQRARLDGAGQPQRDDRRYGQADPSAPGADEGGGGSSDSQSSRTVSPERQK